MTIKQPLSVWTCTLFDGHAICCFLKELYGKNKGFLLSGQKDFDFEELQKLKCWIKVPKFYSLVPIQTTRRNVFWRETIFFRFFLKKNYLRTFEELTKDVWLRHKYFIIKLDSPLPFNALFRTNLFHKILIRIEINR